MNEIKQSTLHQFGYLMDLLNQLKEEQYTYPIDLFDKVSIGQQVRHSIEFYLCLLNQKGTGVISYDSRKRDLLLETNINYASSVLMEIRHTVSDLLNDEVMSLSLEDSLGPSTTIQTNLGRELYFCMDHLIHHLALIKIGVKHCFPNIQLGEGFGYAPSTLAYQKKVCVQ